MRAFLALASIAVMATVLSACAGNSSLTTTPATQSQAIQQSTAAQAQSSAQSGLQDDVPLDGKHIVYPLRGAQHSANGTSNLIYHGGPVMNTPTVYVVYWGWTSDPSGEQPYLHNYLSGVGGSPWLNTVTQYSSTVNSTVTKIANPAGQLGGEFSDNSNPIPSHPSDSQIAAEAVRAAQHFNISGNNVMVMVATPHGESTRGFGVRWCAYHSYTSTSSIGNLAYTNFPYMTDAGANCGEDFVNSGAAGLLDGVSIVGGHEYAEAITDVYPSSGWLDSSGSEIGDKCAWSSTSADITLATGTFAVQPLWSNASSGCVMSF